MSDPNNPSGSGEPEARDKVIQGPWDEPDVRVVPADERPAPESEPEKLDVEVTGFTSSSDDKGPSEQELGQPITLNQGYVIGPDGVEHRVPPLVLPGQEQDSEK